MPALALRDSQKELAKGNPKATDRSKSATAEQVMEEKNQNSKQQNQVLKTKTLRYENISITDNKFVCCNNKKKSVGTTKPQKAN